MRVDDSWAKWAVMSLFVGCSGACTTAPSESYVNETRAQGDDGGVVSVERQSELVTNPPEATGDNSPIELDCTADSPLCPAFTIAGDPIYSLPQWHGYSDPTISRDPVSGRLWMAYVWPNLAFTPKPGGADPEGVVDIHLAHSDDDGQSWHYDSVWYQSTFQPDPGGSGLPGYVSHEVPTLVHQQTDTGVQWYAAHLQYFLKTGPGLRNIKGDSWSFVVTRADSPLTIGSNDEALLGGAYTAAGWGVAVNLSDLAPELAACTLWTEPSLFFAGDTLYLAATCMVWDTEYHTELGAVALFATEPAGAPATWTWRFVGDLAGPEVAAELGGDNLLQTELATTRSGEIIAIMTPNHYDEQLAAEVHHGAWVLGVESLDPPVLARNNDGSLAIKAIITASDLAVYGPAATAYDPALQTGIIFVRREFSVQEMFWSLHATGIHP